MLWFHSGSRETVKEEKCPLILRKMKMNHSQYIKTLYSIYKIQFCFTTY